MEALYRLVIMTTTVAVAVPFLEGNVDLNTNNSMFSTRIFNGAATEPHAIPYQVFYTAHTNTRRVMHFCGGSLISRKHVLTAAHCLNGVDWVLLLFGVYDIFKVDRDVLGRRVDRKNFLIHPEFNEKIGENDIAVIYLIFPVPLSETIQIVTLPRISHSLLSFDCHEVETSGWGSLSDLKNTMPARLQNAKLSVMSLNDCQKYYNFPLHPSLICALGKAKENVCSGDSGGPLTLQEMDGSKTILGITSFGSPRGCDVNIPAVFTRVSSFLIWIWKTTGIQLAE